MFTVDMRERVGIMATGRIIDSDGNAVLIQRPTTDQVLDVLMETNRTRRNRLQADLMRACEGGVLMDSDSDSVYVDTVLRRRPRRMAEPR